MFPSANSDPAATASAMIRAASLSDLLLDFFEDGRDDGGCRPELAGSDDEEDDCMTAAERSAFWESQNQLLFNALSKTSFTEVSIRAATEESQRNFRRSSAGVCVCSGSGACRNCLLQHTAAELRCEGFNSAICRCKWSRSSDTLPGEHSYIDVEVTEPDPRKKGPGPGPTGRVVVELSFRAEFEVARGSEEYNSLVRRLPEVFVGKPEKLKSVIKIMCAAAKQCMRDNKMHVAPWRRHKYMQSKWLGAWERVPSPGPLPSPAKTPAHRPPAAKLRASMLTMDLHRTTVEVV